MMRDNEDLRGIAGCRTSAGIIAAVNGGLKSTKVVRRKGSLVFYDKGAYEKFKAAYPDAQASFVGPTVQNPVMEVRNKLLPTINACHKGELRRNPGLSGKIGVVFEVGPDGKADKLAITEDTLGSPKVSMCISRLISNHQFAPQEGTTKVALPLVFVG